jgi:hypothetical protein
VSNEPVDRLRSALTGAPATPVVEGFSFVDPRLLPGLGGPRRPAPALAYAAADLHLDFAFVPSWEHWALEAVYELHAVGVAAVWAVPGVLTPTFERLGAAEALRAIARDPVTLSLALDESAAASGGAIESGLVAGADAVVVADDLAGAAGPVASAAFLDGEVFPRLAVVARRAADAGVPAVLHCDGAAESLYASVRASGFAAVHGDCGGAGRTAAALAAARRAGVALVSGIAAADLGGGLTRAAAAGATAATAAAGGGLLLADDGGVATAAECAALFAAFGAARR